MNPGRDPIAAARELVPLLASHAAATEARRALTPEVVAALEEAGLLGLGAPVADGAPTVDLDVLFEVCFELARGCASTSWVVGVWGTHSWALGLGSERVRQEAFADGSAVRISAAANPALATVERADGGFLVSGSWPLASGVDHSDWVLVGGAAKVLPGRPADAIGPLLLVSRDDVEIEDDWFVTGLKGTGSKSVRIERPLFVPDHRLVDLHGGEHGPAKEDFGRPSYGVPNALATYFVLGATPLGAADAMIHATAEMLGSRPGKPGRPGKAESPAAQMRLARARAAVDAALALTRADYGRLLGTATEPEFEMTNAERGSVRLHQSYNALAARQAVNELIELAGTAGVRSESVLQRAYGDVAVATQHISLAWDEAAESYGRVLVGLEPNALVR